MRLSCVDVNAVDSSTTKTVCQFRRNWPVGRPEAIYALVTPYLIPTAFKHSRTPALCAFVPLCLPNYFFSPTSLISFGVITYFMHFFIS